MIAKKPLDPQRVRRINGSFAFIEHRFLRHGFWEDLSHHELLLYIFLVLVADRKGLSYYSYDKICTLLRISVDEYIIARNTLIERDLIAFDGYLFQVLSLPDEPMAASSKPIRTKEEMQQKDPATIHQLIQKSLSE
jgi:hypothetical protein